jgi:nucleolar complex protein 2
MGAGVADSTLYPLVYPFVQVTLGVMELLPVSRYFPLKFVCAALLNEVAAACNIYVPLAPYLLAIFQSAEFNK